MKKPPSHSKPVALVMQARHQDLQQLFQKLHEIKRLQKSILPMIDQTMHAYIDISYDFNKQALVLVVANDAIAMRLRFQHDDLLVRIKREPHLKHIQAVHIKMQSYKHQRGRKTSGVTHKMAQLSKDSAATFAASAETITHPALKAVMQRIAKRIKGSSSDHN